MSSEPVITNITSKKQLIQPIYSKINQFANSLGVWLVVVLFFIFLSITTETFLTMANIVNVVRQISVNALVALGAGYVIFSGEIDLTPSSMVAFTGCSVALLMRGGTNIWLAIIMVLILGSLIGVFTGSVITFLKINSFIATMGIWYVLAGITLLLTNSQPISGLPPLFMQIGRGHIFNVIPIPIIIVLVFFSVGGFVLKYTAFGRSVISVGENAESARLSGINVIKTKILAFAIGGFTASAAGIVLASRLSSGQPTAGADLGLTAIAAVFVGGTDKPSGLSVLAGAFVLGLVNNGLNLLRVNTHWQRVALGAIIVIAVLLDQIRAARAVAKA